MMSNANFKLTEDNIQASLSYISILFIVPLIVKRDNPYVMGHVRQGLLLFIAEIIVWLLLGVLAGGMLPFSVGDSITGFWLIHLIQQLVALLWVGVSVVGIYYALQGKSWSLPLIGQYASKIKI